MANYFAQATDLARLSGCDVSFTKNSIGFNGQGLSFTLLAKFLFGLTVDAGEDRPARPEVRI